MVLVSWETGSWHAECMKAIYDASESSVLGKPVWSNADLSPHQGACAGTSSCGRGRRPGSSAWSPTRAACRRGNMSSDSGSVRCLVPVDGGGT